MRRLFAAVALAAVLGGCAKQNGPAEAVRTFFDLVAAGKTADAFAAATYSFREQQTLSFFETTLHEIGLDAFTSVKFDSPEYRDERRTARVEAVFTTRAKATIDLVVTLIEESGAWRILSIKSPRDRSTGMIVNHFTLVGRDPSFLDPTVHHAVPSLEAVKLMAHDSLLAFNEAVLQKSFLDFFDHCSLRWQDQLATGEPAVIMAGTMRKPLSPRQRELGAGRLLHAFQSFSDKQINIGGIDGIQPVLDRGPWVNTDGLLVISGYYPTQPYRVVFNLKYTYEVPLWKLFGLDVSLAPAEPGKS